MTQQHRVVILGAGIAGLYIAQELKKQRSMSVTLVSPAPHFVFLPRLTEYVAHSTQESNVLLPIKDVWSGEFIQQKATLIEPSEKRVVLESGDDLHYDTLVVAIGAQTNFFGTQGAEYAYPFYSKEDADKLWKHLGDMLSADEGPGTHTIAVVGAGPTGVELSRVISDFVLPRRPQAKLLLVQAAPEILPSCPKLAPHSEKVLTKSGFTILKNTSVTKIHPLNITIEPKGENPQTIPCMTVVWAAGSKPSPISVAGVTLSPRGEIPVTKSLQVEKYPEIFALGDSAATGVPKTAQAALQQAVVAAENIVRHANAEQTKEFVNKDKGTVIALEKDTCGDFMGVMVTGRAARMMRDAYYRLTIKKYR